MNPTAIAQRIIELRTSESELTGIHLYRGSPDFHRDPEATAVFRDEKQRWDKDALLVAHYLPLRYGQRMVHPKESGVDMRLGLDLVELAKSHTVEKIVLFSGDSDLFPAVEDAMKTTTRIELAGWALDGEMPGNALSPQCRQRYNMWTHQLTADDFWGCQDRSLRTAA